jgi:hypothetical protein
MKRYLVLLLLLLVVSGVQAQEIRETRLVIGVGNEKIDTYYRVLELLQTIPEISVINTCDQHRIIAITKKVSFYKDDMDFLKFLCNEIEDLVVYIKDDSILKNECQGDIIKQNLK